MASFGAAQLSKIGGVKGLAPVVAAALALAAAACAPPETEKTAALRAPSVAPPASTEISRFLATAPDASIAGEALNVTRLKSFYARHGFQPVWTTRQAQADSLTDAVMRARDHGLAPELFHGNLLRATTTLSPVDRDLLLSDAFLAYADALARGALPVERRREDETLNPGPIDLAAALDGAIDSSDPALVVEGLAPQTPTYQLLREALHDPRIGDGTRRQAIEVNLERERWLPRRLPGTRVWVNVADQHLTAYRDGEPALTTKIIIGQAERINQTPELKVPIDAIWFNPPWNIPDDIARNEILPKTVGDPDYLARHNLTMLPNGILQQRASPTSGLGVLMFDMNNKFDVYLHDTPSKELFRRDDRRISHGCIRVEEPRKLAALVMDQPLDAIDRAIATGDTVRTPVAKPVPVFVVYETAFADSDGKLQFRADIYGRDAEIWRALVPAGRVVAER